MAIGPDAPVGSPSLAADSLPIALRPWVVPVGWERGPQPSGQSRPEHMLVFDCETRLTAHQRLTFGSARLYRRSLRHSGDDPGDWEWFSEYLFHDEVISQDELEVLHSFVESLPTVDRFDPLWVPEEDTFSTAGTRIHVNEHGVHIFLVDSVWFVKHVLRPFAFTQARALVVAYNTPFDISRIARGWGEAHSRRRPADEANESVQRFDSFAGGFSLWLEEYVAATGQRHENAFAPRFVIKTIDSKRHLMALRRGRRSAGDDRGDGFPGNFLDLHTLAYALTNTNFSLRRACEAFGVVGGKLDWEPTGTISAGELAYNRQDTAATFELAFKLLAEYDRHPISPDADAPAARTLSETRAYSPASIGKAYLRAMGLKPVLERQPDFPPEVLGYAMTAFYGGRAECRIRRTPMPVVYADFLSMYPTVIAETHIEASVGLRKAGHPGDKAPGPHAGGRRWPVMPTAGPRRPKCS